MRERNEMRPMNQGHNHQGHSPTFPFAALSAVALGAGLDAVNSVFIWQHVENSFP